MAKDRVTEIEKLLDEEIEAGDSGDGSLTHLLAARSNLGGYRDAKRAWAHPTESPLSSGAARDQALEKEKAGA